MGAAKYEYGYLNANSDLMIVNMKTFVFFAQIYPWSK